MLESYLDGNVQTWTRAEMLGLPLTGAAYRSPAGEVVWIDPPDPGAHEAALLALGKPTDLLVTFRDHDRHVDALAERYGARVWVPKGAGGEIKRIDEEFGETSTLPAGLKAVAMPAMGYGEHALVAEAYGKKFAFIGDAVFNLEGTAVPWLVRTVFFKQRRGPLAMKRQYRGGDTAAAPDQLRRLLPLKLDLLFLSHGRAIDAEADRWLRDVLGDPPA